MVMPPTIPAGAVWRCSCQLNGMVPFGTPSPLEHGISDARRSPVLGDAALRGLIYRPSAAPPDRFASGCRQSMQSGIAAGTAVPRPSGTNGAGGALFAAEALALLDSLALGWRQWAGEQSDRMTRDDGWRMLTLGRQLERLWLMK